MLQRPATRIELRPEDKEELEAQLRKQEVALAKGAKLPLGPKSSVEVKLRLDGREAHDRLVNVLSKSVRQVWEQENFFFDGTQGELSSQRHVMRVRIYNGCEKAIITIKGQMTVIDGVGRASEEEVAVDPKRARLYVSDPAMMLTDDIELVKAVTRRLNVGAMKSLGGFKNTRTEITWSGNLLEVDQTQYEWGTVYEIECETSDPEEVRSSLEKFLSQHDIGYKYNTTTKFQNFINRTLE